MKLRIFVVGLSTAALLGMATGCGVSATQSPAVDGNMTGNRVASLDAPSTGSANNTTAQSSSTTNSSNSTSAATGNSTSNSTSESMSGITDAKEAVTAIQQRLNKLGFSVGKVDGVFGLTTIEEVEKFQSHDGLSVDGVVGANTWSALFAKTAQSSEYPGYVLQASNAVQQQFASEQESEDSSTDGSSGASSQNKLWLEPTGGPYPDLKKYKNVWVDVSISKQRTYIKSGNKTIYTMIVSTGLAKDGDATPTGTFHIQAERGTWFYAPRFKEGAEYWVSFLHHGEYLFHSVPMNEDKQLILKDAEALGKEDSHGCVHLSIPDAKWFYENIPYGTKVVIQA